VLTGLLRAHVHYYEDGNVQLNSEKEVTVSTMTATSPRAIAEAMVKHMSQMEGIYQSALNESYNELSDTTFKGLRRALPVTRNKLDWNKVSTSGR